MASGAVSLGRGINIIRAGGGSSGGALDTDARTYCDNALIFGQTPIQYDNAASLNGTNQYLSVPSNSSLQNGGGSFSVALWVNFSSSAVQVILNKGTQSVAEYEIYRVSDGFGFSVGNGTSYLEAKFSVTPTIGTWYYIVGQYDAVAQKPQISVNGSAFTVASSTISQPAANSSALEIGRRNNSNYTSGQIAHVGFWKRLLTSSEISRLYNGGLGLPYASFDSALTTNLVSYWRLNSTADSAGSNTLTNNNSVPFTTIGPVATAYDNARSLINSFVLGIKGLGLWNNMVCWPLRASQNAFLLGNGLTARSLGGLGTFNGTLTNIGNSAWGSQGLNLTPNTSLSGTLPGFSTSGVSLFKVGSLGNLGGWYKTLGSANTYGLWSHYGGDQLFYLDLPQQNPRLTAASNNTANTMFMAAGYGSPSGKAIYKNTSLLATDALAIGSVASASDYIEGCLNASAVETVPFVMQINSDARASNTSIYNIYKSTIGQGLGLP